jgi:phospholipid/cholesterol/gamma-HCH transport system substrate-binding protein
MKKVNFELGVGLFLIAGFLAFVYLSVQLGEFSIFSLEKQYRLSADFDNISGLKEGAVIEIAGVTVGKVSDISLGEADLAHVEMLIDKGVEITDDAVASVRTQGIIGDKIIRIIQGGSEVLLEDEGEIMETESVVDIEELISKYIFDDSGE